MKVGVAFFDKKFATRRKREHCECEEADEEVGELARLWKEVQDYERKVTGKSDPWEDIKNCRRFDASSMTYWFKVSTGRLKHG